MRFNTARFQTIALWIYAIGIIIVFLYLAFFTFPAADDYCMAIGVGNNGVINTIINEYLSWNGRFSATTFISINSLAWDNALLSQAMIAMGVISFWGLLILLIRTLILPRIKISQAAVLASTFILILNFSSPSLYEWFYWYASAATYLWGAIISILAILILLILISRPKISRIKSNLLIIPGLMLWFVAMGFNETQAGINLAISGFLLISAFFRDRVEDTSKRNRYLVISYFIVGLIGATLLLFAPGNEVRTSEVESAGIINAIFLALTQTIKTIPVWLNPAFILSCLLFAHLLYKYHTKPSLTSKKYVYLLVPLMTVLFVWGGFIISFYSTNTPGPVRSQNLIQLFFYLGIYSTIFLTPYFVSATRLAELQLKPLVFIILSVSLIYLTLLSGDNREVIRTIINSDQHKFAADYQQSIDTAVKTGVLEPPNLAPSPIYSSDFEVTSDPSHWRNRCFSSHWKIESVTLANQENQL